MFVIHVEWNYFIMQFKGVHHETYPFSNKEHNERLLADFKKHMQPLKDCEFAEIVAIKTEIKRQRDIVLQELQEKNNEFGREKSLIWHVRYFRDYGKEYNERLAPLV